jgi:hypothetical protein
VHTGDSKTVPLILLVVLQEQCKVLNPSNAKWFFFEGGERGKRKKDFCSVLYFVEESGEKKKGRKKKLEKKREVQSQRGFRKSNQKKNEWEGGSQTKRGRRQIPLSLHPSLFKI